MSCCFSFVCIIRSSSKLFCCVVIFGCYWIFFLLSVDFFVYFFFFSSRRRHTRCLSDWSSDVCSSDLQAGLRRLLAELGAAPRQVGRGRTDLGAALARAEALLRRPSLIVVVSDLFVRSEERSVGKECRHRGGTRCDEEIDE